MKRHPSLIPLSREHHDALILARMLQIGTPAYKGMPSDPEGKIKYAQKFYEEELIQHFEEEEKVLELIEGISSSLDLISAIILREHRELHKLFKSLADSKDITARLDDLGKLLENHVRTEERVLFPLIQESCNEDIMIRIEKILTA